jgi:hypothetical protein
MEAEDVDKKRKNRGIDDDKQPEMGKALVTFYENIALCHECPGPDRTCCALLKGT